MRCKQLLSKDQSISGNTQISSGNVILILMEGMGFLSLT